MTTSGTYTFGDTEQIDIITEAYERVGRNPGTLSSNDIDSARRSINYMFSDWADNGPNLWAVDLQSIALTPGTLDFDLEPRTVSLLQVYTRTVSGSQNTDLMMSPISRAEYDALPNKAQLGQRPFQYYFQRTITPRIYIWQAPQDVGVTLFVSPHENPRGCRRVHQRHGRAEPVGWKLSLLASPPSWLLNSHLTALSFFQGLADGAYNRAAAEDRERVPLRIAIDQWGY